MGIETADGPSASRHQRVELDQADWVIEHSIPLVNVTMVGSEDAARKATICKWTYSCRAAAWTRVSITRITDENVENHVGLHCHDMPHAIRVACHSFIQFLK